MHLNYVAPEIVVYDLAHERPVVDINGSGHGIRAQSSARSPAQQAIKDSHASYLFAKGLNGPEAFQT